MFSHGPRQHDEEHRVRQASASLPPWQCQHPLQPYQVNIALMRRCLENMNLFRLLKGAPPGQEAVNHYISELSIEKKNQKKILNSSWKQHTARKSLHYLSKDIFR